ncbi:putative Atrial natriuretic peptide receptor 1 [Hypsibius exemplaris]|uniref:guanylate cyclase n=1 Tax=Hypsibius exemplaris TaxID=2072580 RepID=A0A1W0WAC2_HYPEX|nr:putative Atrial natriuretic peptide receptor 1 [Hypsibius exemplaris]
MHIWSLRHFLIGLISSTINLTFAGNITLISITATDDGRADFWSPNVVFDVVTNMLFSNITHIPLLYRRDGNYSALKDKPEFILDRSPLTSPPPRKCEARSIADFFFKFYYDHQELFIGHLEQQFTIVTITDTKALLALSVPISDLSDIDRYPTVLNFFSMPDAYFVHTVALLAQRFRWSGINVLCNIESFFEGKLCRLFDEFLQTSVARNLEIHKTLVAIRYEDEMYANFTAVYPHLTSQRVIMVLLGPPLLRTFMIDAHSRNMTNGDYEAFLAFQSLIIIADSEGNHSGPQEVNWKVHMEMKRRYNLMQKIEDETLERTRHYLDRMTIADFVKECCNQSYNLTSRQVYVDQLGVLRSLTVAKRLSPSGLFEAKLIGIGIPIICIMSVLLTALSIFFVRRMTLQNRLAHLVLRNIRLEEPETYRMGSQPRVTKLEQLGTAGFYGETPVYVWELSTNMGLQRLAHNLALVDGLVAVSRARHPFIADFYGIHFNRTSSSLVFERPIKGPLHSVIRANEMIFDFDVRMQIMNAMILALHFIHTSDLSYHGAFSNEVCLINDRYVLRVVHAGFLRLLNLFHDEGSFRSCCRTSANKVAIIEQYRGDDIKNLGVVLADMFNIDPYVAKELQFESTNTIHQKLHEMVARCLESESHARPTATDLKRWLTTVGVPKKNFVELLLDRLEKHSASLEETVQSRTEALLDETRKVDDLLREMLPSAIITKLRNHEPIIAEMFNSVTIMFSDIPAFGLIVAQSEPLGVIEFLNYLHTAFDRVVAQFDAYKVETINDSYVVASGLPVRNGDRHAEAICRLAQQLLRAGAAVHIPAWGSVTICPRIGINSGLGFMLNLPTWLA